MKTGTLKDLVQFNSSFKTAINLYLSLNKQEKILSYIPTKSSVTFLDDYLKSVINCKEQASLLIGPYGKGKSHLLLVLLGILSLERTKENSMVIKELVKKISAIEDDDTVAEHINLLWKQKRLLPVIVNDTKGDLNQSFLTALNDALKRAGLSELAPDTYYTIAIDRIQDWEKNYKDTYNQFVKELRSNNSDPQIMKSELKLCSRDALDLFVDIYPKVTAGSTFNPLAVSEVLPLYKGISERLVEETDFSGIYIVFDEFSKFIEGLNGNSIGNNMKLLQDICELATESSNAKVFITMVAHKSIKEYGKYLSTEIINAFTGIEGRIIEKYFVTSSKNNYELVRHAIIKNDDEFKNNKRISELINKEALDKYYRLPVFSGQFEKKDFDDILLKGCFPINPLATYLLLNISEKVAQNERTLFTFISNDEPYSLARYVDEHNETMDWGVGADLIYDYFRGLFKKDVTNELVHNTWLSAETALSKCDTDDEKRIIKTMAIIQIVNKPEEVISTDNYIELATRIIDADAFESLKQKKIIYVKASTGAYVFKTKAGTELRSEIKRQKEIKGENIDYCGALEKISDRHFVVPRKYNNIHKMTRYFKFEYMDVDVFLSINEPDVLFDKKDHSDGKVLCLYSFSTTRQTEVKKHFKSLACERLVVIAPKKKIGVHDQLKEYEIIQGIKNDQYFITNNEVTKKEIPLLEDDIEALVEKELTSIYLDDNDCTVMSYDGSKSKLYKPYEVEVAVNECCERLYFKTPEINNEIMNRSFISSVQTRKTRVNIISEIMSRKGKVEEEYYIGTNQEATVYRSLFVKTGIVAGKTEKNLDEILKCIDEYIDSCCDQRISFKSIVDKLTAAPFGMRMGVIPIYLAYKLSQRNEDLVVYYTDGEVQLTSEIIVNVCEKCEDHSLFVPKESKEREEYIKSINDLFGVNDARNITDNRIKNIVICMQRWFRSLPQIARNLAEIETIVDKDQISHMKTIRKMLQKIEYNSYEIVFVNLPEEFGSKDFADTFRTIKKCKALFDEYYERAIGIAGETIYKVYGGKKKTDIYHLMKEWYDCQSGLSKQGLHSGRITNLMSCIEKLDVFDDSAVTKKIVKAVTDVYIDNWSDGSLEDFERRLSEIKSEIESIQQDNKQSQLKLSFTGKAGQVERYYEPVDEGTGSVLRNILEDTLEEFEDLSVNDRVGILLEMIEKIIG